ncbi:hypothetical protein M9435_001629 [Picochlorum sp. BPE23]|nr:hypothetical protein M9435_001629 [Picochlorum sp. BPE23]
MKALVYSSSTGLLEYKADWPSPLSSTTSANARLSDGSGIREYPSSSSKYQAVLKMLRVAICNTDIEITRGYVEGYESILGHEGVGRIVEIVDTVSGERLESHPMLGARVVVEINCPCDDACNAVECVPSTVSASGMSKVYLRNHAPSRTVIGIINRDGLMAEYCKVPLDNCHRVRDDITDAEAAFCEPLAAAYRIVEQALVNPDQGHEKVAVVGDGKLGLLIAHVLGSVGCSVVFFGKHENKMMLVKGVEEQVIVSDTNDSAITSYHGSFDVVVEASGHPSGILMSAALCRPLGRVILKSTCAIDTNIDMPAWSAIANDIVVNEKVLIGSRCGPMEKGLELLQQQDTKDLVNAMVDAVFPIEQGLEAFEAASKRGSLKIQMSLDSPTSGDPHPSGS